MSTVRRPIVWMLTLVSLLIFGSFCLDAEGQERTGGALQDANLYLKTTQFNPSLDVPGLPKQLTIPAAQSRYFVIQLVILPIDIRQ